MSAACHESSQRRCLLLFVARVVEHTVFVLGLCLLYAQVSWCHYSRWEGAVLIVGAELRSARLFTLTRSFVQPMSMLQRCVTQRTGHGKRLGSLGAILFVVRLVRGFVFSCHQRRAFHSSLPRPIDEDISFAFIVFAPAQRHGASVPKGSGG